MNGNHRVSFKTPPNKICVYFEILLNPEKNLWYIFKQLVNTSEEEIELSTKVINHIIRLKEEAYLEVPGGTFLTPY